MMLRAVDKTSLSFKFHEERRFLWRERDVLIPCDKREENRIVAFFVGFQ
jgi:hypothetical protein